MSEPQSNSEILDILSSIRRLVSEARNPGVKTPATPNDAAAPDTPSFGSAGTAAPETGRFVLTPALRIEEPELPDEQRNPSAGAVAVDWTADALADGPKADPTVSTPTPTLEETIAELEAAVSEIETDFEPDVGQGGDNAPTPDAEADETVDLRTLQSLTGFQGIIAGLDAMSLHEDRLDAPITAEGVDETAPPPPSDFTRIVPGFFRESMLGSASMLAFRGAEAAEDTADTQPDDASAEAVAAAVPDQSETEQDIDEGLDADDVAARGAEEYMAKLAAESEGAASVEDDDTALAVDVEDELEEPAAVSGRLHFAGQEASRLRLELPENEPMFVEQDNTSGGAAGEKSDLDDQNDLFDPLAVSDIDVDLLRDMVAEIIREELRGKLGERITRNLRQLVRREIERVLSESDADNM